MAYGGTYSTCPQVHENTSNISFKEPNNMHYVCYLRSKIAVLRNINGINSRKKLQCPFAHLNLFPLFFLTPFPLIAKDCSLTTAPLTFFLFTCFTNAVRYDYNAKCQIVVFHLWTFWHCALTFSTIDGDLYSLYWNWNYQ